jgi:PAS domain S-box-containing protein
MNKDDDRHDLILDRPDGFFVNDAQGRFLDINEQSSIDLGYSREELLAMTINDISIGATPAENAVKWGNAEPGMAMTFREIAVRRDGSSYPVEISVTCQMMQNRKEFVGLARRVNDQVLQPDTAPALRGSLFELSSLQQQRHLLDRFQVLATDMDRLKRSALAVFGVRELHVSSAPFEVRASVVSLNELGLVYVATTTDFTCSFPEEAHFRLQFAISGSGTTATADAFAEIDEQRACILPPGQHSELHLRGGHRRLALRIAPDAFKRKLSALMGGMPSGELVFEPSLDMTLERSQRLLQTTLFLAETVNWSSSAKVPSLALRELEQAVIVAALEAGRHSHSRFLQGAAAAAAPHHVRKAEEYIEANWSRLVPIEELVAVAGVGARTLFRSFSQFRGRSPMQFARLVRLQRARELLSAPTSETTVIGTALACGYSNASHFARHYFEAFGERPSQTLARHS